MGRVVILSDLHLGSEASRTHDIQAFLNRGEWDWLYLNGDTLDNLDLRCLKKKEWKILDLLRGARATVTIGNHDIGKDGSDLLLRSIFTNCSVENSISVADGRKRYRLSHGHRFDPLLNFALLTEIADQAYHLSQKLNKRLSRWLKKRSKSFGGFIDVLVQKAVQTTKADGFDGVILGHTHHVEDRFIDDVHYINSGCWTGNENPTYIEIVDDQLPRLCTFRP